MLFLLYVDVFFFFFNDTATTEIYTLSLHDALPISFANSPTQSRYGPFASWANRPAAAIRSRPFHPAPSCRRSASETDRKSTRLNSSHSQISYAVFCLKKKTMKRTARPSDSFNSRQS